MLLHATEEWNQLPIDLSGNTGVSEIRVNGIGEINRCGSSR